MLMWACTDDYQTAHLLSVSDYVNVC